MPGVQKGYKRSEETKRRMSEAAKRRWENDDKNKARMSDFSTELWSSAQHRQRISSKAKDQSASERDERSARAKVQAEAERWSRSERHKKLWQNPEFRESTLRKSHDRASTPEAKEKMSRRSKAAWAAGKMDHVRNGYGKGGKYRGVYMRSSWEREYARKLDKSRIKWEYEPQRFLLSDGSTYCPDFHLVDADEWVEVKGYWRDDAIRKFEMFRREYPEVRISVVGYKEIFDGGNEGERDDDQGTPRD